MVMAQAQPVSAHRDGCHRWHSCPSDSGSYVCGDLGYTSECPGVTTPPPAASTPIASPPPAPVHVPVITKKTITTDEAVAFTTTTTYTGNEYPDYKKVTQTGANGLRRIQTEVSFSDGVETGRQVIKNDIVQQPVDELVVVGKRMKPQAKLTAFTTTKKKDKFDIKGAATPKSTVVLSLDGKRIKRAKADVKGNFVFKGIKVVSNTPRIEIYNRVGRIETRISEPTVIVSKSSSKMQTEYQKLHPASTVKPAAQTVSAPVQQSSLQSTPAASLTPAPTSTVSYANCTAARAAGVTPIYRGQPGYAASLDRDADGIACE